MKTYKNIKQCAEFWGTTIQIIRLAIKREVLLLNVHGDILLLPEHNGMKADLELTNADFNALIYNTGYKALDKYKVNSKINNMTIYERNPSWNISLKNYIIMTPDGRFYSHHDTYESAKTTAFQEGKYSVRRRHGKNAIVISMSISPDTANEIIDTAILNPDNTSLVYIANMIQRNMTRKNIQLSTSLPENLKYKSA